MSLMYLFLEHGVYRPIYFGVISNNKNLTQKKNNTQKKFKEVDNVKIKRSVWA